MNDIIKMVLTDDEVLFRKGISFLLQRKKNIRIIFEASNGEELITFLRTTPELPEIVLLDIKMPVVNGVETARLIHNEFPEIKIIALSSYDTKSFIANMIDVGAAAYLVKSASPKELLATVNEVHVKGYYYNDTVLGIVHNYVTGQGKRGKSRFDENQLTIREIEVLKLICLQYSAAEIAKQLFLSSRTVEGHRNNLLKKTECKNMVGLIIYAIQNEIFSIDGFTH